MPWQQEMVFAAALWLKYQERESQRLAEGWRTTRPKIKEAHQIATRLGWTGRLEKFYRYVREGSRDKWKPRALELADRIEIPDDEVRPPQPSHHSCVFAAAVWLRLWAEEGTKWRNGERENRPLREEAYEFAVALGWPGSVAKYRRHSREGLSPSRRSLAEAMSLLIELRPECDAANTVNHYSSDHWARFYQREMPNSRRRSPK